MFDAIVEEVQRKHRLAGAGRAADQGAAGDRQAALAHIIEALDPCRELLNLQRLTAGRGELHGNHL